MENKIEKGDIVKIIKPIEFDDIDGNIMKAEYGIVMDVSSTHVRVSPYNIEGKMICRKHDSYILPHRVDFNIKDVRLFLKGNEPDGLLLED